MLRLSLIIMSHFIPGGGHGEYMWIYRSVDRFGVGDLVMWGAPGFGTIFGKSVGSTWIVIPTPATATHLNLSAGAGVLLVSSLLKLVAPAHQNNYRYMIEECNRLEYAMVPYSELDS